jgi:cellulose binding protein with CBM2 domain
MGSHTKLEEDLSSVVANDVPADLPEEGGNLGWVAKVPLLPLIAGIGAVSVVVAAWSTSQISLNFAGGSPAQPLTEAQNGAVAPRGPSQDRAAPPDRANAATISFRATGRSETGFRGVVTITNRGSRPIDDWTLVFRIPNARVLSASNVELVKAGSVATVRQPEAASEIEPGESVRLVYTARGPASAPSACSFNGVVCTLD